MRKALPTCFIVSIVVTFFAACSGSDSPDNGSTLSGSTLNGNECRTDSDCGSANTCKRWRCEVQKCVAENAPAGTLAPDDFAAPPCKRTVCDGEGATTFESDPTNLPPNATGDCLQPACDAAGNVTTMPDMTDEPSDQVAGDCKRTTCDASGNKVTAPDLSDMPMQTMGDCKDSACDASGNETTMPNQSDVPNEITNDCKKNTCDANGNATTTPNQLDLPSEITGDCRKNTCDVGGNETTTPDTGDTPMDTPGDCKVDACNASGNVVKNPANDPPAPTMCANFTCQNGAPVTMAKNVGMNCSAMGYVCGTQGLCNDCPNADAACTEIGPGIGNHSVGTAFSFGGLGKCDGSGSSFCGRLAADVTAHYVYSYDGSGFLCSFDPYVGVSASWPVKLCQYFDADSVACPATATSATLNGLPGCCATSTAPSLSLGPVGLKGLIYVTVAPTILSDCTSYELDFHL